jgi:hypothetical protein
MLCHFRPNLLQGWEYSKERQRPTLDEHLVVDTNLKRAIWSCDHLDVSAEVTSQHRRRPGSVDRGDSIDAPLDRHLGHRVCGERLRGAALLQSVQNMPDPPLASKHR